MTTIRLIILIPALLAAVVAEAGERPACDKIAGARVAPEGPVRVYLDRVTVGWLLPGPEANPAILAMFRDRDRRPYRDLLPWSGEFAGKYLTGATSVYRLTRDPALKARLAAFVKDLVALQDADGYLGPFPHSHRLTGTAPNIGGKPGGSWDAWGHYHVMLGLLAWDAAVVDPAALAAARRIGDVLCDRFLGDKRPRLVDTGSTEMNLAPAHGLALLHRKTGERRYLDLADQLIGEFAALGKDGKPLAGDYLRRGLAGEPFYATPRPRWESLHPILALAELHRITGETPYRTAFEDLWWSIVEFDRHNNGGFSSGEQAQGNPYHRGAIETCCTIAWMAMSVEMLRLTADPIVADELELSTWNSALGMFTPSGRWSTYNTPMDGVRKANYHEIGFQCRPGSPELNCCSVNAARGLGLIDDWAVLGDAKGLLLNWYGPGLVAAPVESGGSVRLVQETDYPRDGAIKIRVEPDREAAFSLRLRVPHWSARTSAKVNGQPVEGIAPGRYLDLTRTWKAGYVIELNLDLAHLYWSGEKESSGRASIYRGPILLAYDPRFNPSGQADPPALDVRSLALSPAAWDGPVPPILLVDAKAADGRIVRLCDFASAGADGSAYRSWLKVEHAPASAFGRDNPRRKRPGPLRRRWSGLAGPAGAGRIATGVTIRPRLRFLEILRTLHFACSVEDLGRRQGENCCVGSLWLVSEGLDPSWACGLSRRRT